MMRHCLRCSIAMVEAHGKRRDDLTGHSARVKAAARTGDPGIYRGAAIWIVCYESHSAIAIRVREVGDFTG